MKVYYSSFIIFLIGISVISGCSSDSQYVPPSKVESTTNGEVATEKTEPDVTQPTTKTFGIGDTATDNELDVTVNNVRFSSVINEKDNEFLVAQAPTGKQYAIIDLTVENSLPDKTQSISTLVETTVVDQDGYNYDVDFEGFTALDKTFKDGEVLPGMKKRGEVPYLVPADATDLKFVYKFDVFTGTSAVFDIK